MSEKKQITMSLGTVAIVTVVLVAILGFAIYFGVQYYISRQQDNIQLVNANNKEQINKNVVNDIPLSITDKETKLPQNKNMDINSEEIKLLHSYIPTRSGLENQDLQDAYQNKVVNIKDISDNIKVFTEITLNETKRENYNINELNSIIESIYNTTKIENIENLVSNEKIVITPNSAIDLRER